MSHPPFLRPFFTFHGGKWNISTSYPAPLHDTIIEPFAGSAGYSLYHYRKRVILVDIDPQISAAWRFLIESSKREILSLPNLVQGASVDNLDICPGAKSLIGFWCGRGRAKPGTSITGWGRNPKYSRYYWGVEAKERIASQVEHIKHWTMIEGSFETVSSIGGDATWFVDPPYRLQGNGYTYNNSMINYEALSEWCESLKGQVIVCEGSDAGWLPFRPLCTVLGNNGRLSSEYVWVRG